MIAVQISSMLLMYRDTSFQISSSNQTKNTRKGRKNDFCRRENKFEMKFGREFSIFELTFLLNLTKPNSIIPTFG